MRLRCLLFYNTLMESATLYLRPCKAEYAGNLQNIYHRNMRPLKFEIIENGIISPGDIPQIWNSCVFTPEGLPVSYAVEGLPSSHVAENKYSMESRAISAGEIKYPGKRVLYAGYLYPHWGHFLMDSLPQLWGAFSDEFPEFDKIIFTAPENWDDSIHANITEALRLSGLYDKIEIISHPARYASVIVPEKGIVACERVSNEALTVFDTIVKNAMEGESGCEYGKKIFLSRHAFTKANRNEPGSEWLDAFFASNGFDIIYPEKKGIAELIRIIRNADIVATLSGTIPHNMIFAREGQKLWIIEKSPLVNKYQEGVNLSRRLDVTGVDANAQIWSISSGSGPFIIYPNYIFRKFASDNSLSDPKPWSDKKKRDVLRRYFRQYKRIWGYEWILDKWDEPEIPSMREAYRDTMRDFGAWLSARKPLTLADALSPRRILKKVISKIRK